MNNSYLELIVETVKTSNLLSKIIKKYLLEKNIGCNVTQIFLLHFLIKLGGTSPVFKLEQDMKHISKNSSYNIQNLVDDGYITKKSGKSLKIDGRWEVASITKNGTQLYTDICEYTAGRISKMSVMGWTEDTFNDYLDMVNDLRFASK